MNVKELHVTMPCKGAAVSCCDQLSQAAELIGAVNTVVYENGVMTGHNTDCLGWVRNCRENGVEIRGKKMTIAGSGGAATAIEITAALEGIRKVSACLPDRRCRFGRERKRFLQNKEWKRRWKTDKICFLTSFCSYGRFISCATTKSANASTADEIKFFLLYAI